VVNVEPELEQHPIEAGLERDLEESGEQVARDGLEVGPGLAAVEQARAEVVEGGEVGSGKLEGHRSLLVPWLAAETNRPDQLDQSGIIGGPRARPRASPGRTGCPARDN